MNWKTTLGHFYSYVSVDDIFMHRQQPLFGLTPTPWRLDVPLWRFLFAETRDMLPVDFANPEFDDSRWRSIRVPSVWQQEGYGYPHDLLYLSANKKAKSVLSVKQKIAGVSASELQDHVGVYRVWIDMTEAYLRRAVYFLTEGICGRVEIYINGQFLSESSSIHSPSKLLLSGKLVPGRNLLTVLVYRLDSLPNMPPCFHPGTFGFSGIYRMPSIICEPLVELSDLRLSFSWFLGTASARVKDQPGAMNNKSDTNVQIVSDVQSDSFSDARIVMDMVFHNRLSKSAALHPRFRIVRAEAQYDIYNLPELRCAVKDSHPIVIAPNQSLSVKNEITVAGVTPWTHATPVLYDLIMEVLDDQNRVIDLKKIRFGFRTIRAADNSLSVNDVPVNIKAVEYYAFDPVNGLSIDVRQMKTDLLLMKKANINTVILRGIPHGSDFFSLCDEIGMYVICSSVISQMKNTILSSQSHPCIVAWRPEYAHHYSNPEQYKEEWTRLDPTRFIYDENKESNLSDISPMPGKSGLLFGSWQDLCLDRKYRMSKLSPNERLFEGIDGRGVHPDDGKAYKVIHQADLSEDSAKTDTPIAQGIVSAFREPHPIYSEIKRQCETIRVFGSPEDAALLTIYNTQPFGATDELEVEWKLLLGGIRVKGGKGIMPPLKAFENRKVQLPFNVNDFYSKEFLDSDPKIRQMLEKARCKELILHLSISVPRDTDIYQKGDEIGFYQEILDDNFNTTAPSKNALAVISSDDLTSITAIQLSATPALIIARAGKTIATFNKSQGALCSLSCNNVECLNGHFLPSFYRAATNLDRSDQSYILSATVFSKETDWRSIQREIEFKKLRYEMDGEDFSVLSEYRSPIMRDPILIFYRLRPSGRLEVTLSFRPRFDPVRYGFRMTSPNATKQITWYGRGPTESYPDRKEACPVGLYRSTPEEMVHLYDRPAESGARSDVRFIAVTSEEGEGVLIRKDNRGNFSFTATPYSPEDLDDNPHMETLPLEDEYEIFLDFYQKEIERTGKSPKHPKSIDTEEATFIFEPITGLEQIGLGIY